MSRHAARSKHASFAASSQTLGALRGHRHRLPRARLGRRPDEQVPSAVDADERAAMHAHAVASGPRAARTPGRARSRRRPRRRCERSRARSAGTRARRTRARARGTAVARASRPPARSPTPAIATRQARRAPRAVMTSAAATTRSDAVTPSVISAAVYGTSAGWSATAAPAAAGRHRATPAPSTSRCAAYAPAAPRSGVDRHGDPRRGAEERVAGRDERRVADRIVRDVGHGAVRPEPRVAGAAGEPAREHVVVVPVLDGGEPRRAPRRRPPAGPATASQEDDQRVVSAALARREDTRGATASEAEQCAASRIALRDRERCAAQCFLPSVAISSELAPRSTLVRALQ